MVKIVVEDLDKLPPIKVHFESLMDIVFYELIRNSLEAMPEGGKITISGSDLGWWFIPLPGWFCRNGRRKPEPQYQYWLFL